MEPVPWPPAARGIGPRAAPPTVGGSRPAAYGCQTPYRNGIRINSQHRHPALPLPPGSDTIAALLLFAQSEHDGAVVPTGMMLSVRSRGLRVRGRFQLIGAPLEYPGGLLGCALSPRWWC
jgi:hypothetical protein